MPPATTLFGGAVTVDVAHILQLAEGVRHAAARGEIPKKTLDQLDVAPPGFTWVDPDRPSGDLAPAVSGLVDRHGVDALSSSKMRKGDNGVANTLRSIDDVIGRRKDTLGIDEDLDALKAMGYLKNLTSYSAAKQKEASHISKSANIEDRTGRITESTR